MDAMLKPELLDEINKIQDQIRIKNSELSEERKNLEALEEFSVQSNSRILSFENSMSRRKNKLNGLDSMLNTVKIAAGYKRKMSDMLNGKEYQRTVNQIDNLMNALTVQKAKTQNSIIRLEDEISDLQAKLQQLQYDYNNFQEEKANG